MAAGKRSPSSVELEALETEDLRIRKPKMKRPLCQGVLMSTKTCNTLMLPT